MKHGTLNLGPRGIWFEQRNHKWVGPTHATITHRVLQPLPAVRIRRDLNRELTISISIGCEIVRDPRLSHIIPNVL